MSRGSRIVMKLCIQGPESYAFLIVLLLLTVMTHGQGPSTTSTSKPSTTSITSLTNASLTTSAATNLPSTTADPLMNATTITTTTTENITTLSPYKPIQQLHEDNLNYSSFDPQFDYCSCDLKTDCDINCCCDESCDSSYKKLFSHCKAIHRTTPNPYYCSKTDLIYRNNSKYMMHKDSNGLFCVVWDNVRDRNYYPDRKPVSSVQEYRKLAGEKTYAWNMMHSDGDPIQIGHIFRYGYPLWITTLAETGLEVSERWSLPASTMSIDHLCDGYKTINYLQDLQHSCLVYIKLDRDCTANSVLSSFNYHSSIHIVKSAPDNIGHLGRESYFRLNHSVANISDSSTPSSSSETISVNPNSVQAPDEHPCTVKSRIFC